ncbi:hypothetical protein SAMN05421841_0459 [Chryseobacterium wanjuense]|uniref:Uncharacterized protein n=1 Tax=Chryseobacterium wanjuense TaxID=356305 RepID=A0A1I0NAF9_9FLAO|nr:hypothetical protein [Chryseobacterium wanjuense]SEV97892.1 hypothetical protein SAMN05421841_0459 [Chryseobacterium wanjuense]
MTKKLFMIASMAIFSTAYSQVGINIESPHVSSALDVTSDTKGFLVPRLTTAAITSLSGTASEGLIVYDKQQKTFLGWNGTKWVNLGFEGSSGGNLQTGVIFTQGFETSDSVNYTTSGFSPSSFNFTSGSSTASDAPGSSALFSEGTRGYGYSTSNTSATVSYLEFNTVDASSYTNNITFSFDVAAFSVGSTTNGMENTDVVTIDISTDGGANYNTKLTLTGGNSSTATNVRWAFTGSGTGTNSYSSSGITVTSSNTNTGSGVTLTGAQAITKLSVTGIPNSSQLKIRVGVRDNAATELWVIDNVKLQAF